MPKPRKTIVCLEATPYYHCVSRCVRKAYLCGMDYTTKQSYEHRRAWVEEELLKQANMLKDDQSLYSSNNLTYSLRFVINWNNYR